MTVFTTTWGAGGIIPVFQLERLWLTWGGGGDSAKGSQLKSQETPRTSAFKASALPFHLLSMPCSPPSLHLWKLRTQIERFPFPKIPCQGKVDEG